MTKRYVYARSQSGYFLSLWETEVAAQQSVKLKHISGPGFGQWLEEPAEWRLDPAAKCSRLWATDRKTGELAPSGVTVKRMEVKRAP